MVPDTSTDPDAEPGLALGTVFEALSNRRRRFALYAIADAGGEVLTAEELVEEVATLEATLSGTPLTRERYLEVATDLHHWHLPVLSDLGVLEWDERSGAIRPGRCPRLATWVARARAEELTPEAPP